MDTTNIRVAQLLRAVAAALLIKKESRFRIVAYEKAADVIEQMAKDLQEIWREGALDDVPGIGESLAGYLDEYFKTGKVKHFAHVFSGIPEATFVLMNVPGIGPKKAYKLATTFDLTNPKTAIADLRKVAEQGKIATLESFGRRSESLIMESLDRYVASQQAPLRMLLPYTTETAESLVNYIKTHPSVLRVDVLGSLRRALPTIGDIDIACIVQEGAASEVIEHFTAYSGKIAVDNRGDKKASIILPPRLRVDFRVEEKEGYGAMLQYFTGSKAHNIKLREYALTKGYSLSEWGIKEMRVKDHPLKRFSTEESFYRFLGLPYIPPELREDRGEIEAARTHKLPHLIEFNDIQGDFHIHSEYDLKPSHDRGANTFEEMVTHAKVLKYSYLGFSEHNPKMSGHTAGEIVDILKRRHEALETLKSTHKSSLDIYNGLEVDILPSGELALPEKAVEYVDYLIVSIHSSFTQSKEDMTKRVISALLHPKVRIWGHPTGRLLMKRDGIDVLWNDVFEVVKKRNVALEINSSADRLDLPDSLVKEARDRGHVFVINTDAHAVTGMDSMRYGVSVARRGWLEKKDVVNSWPADKFRRWLEDA